MAPETSSAERMVENIARDSHQDPVVTVGIVSHEEQPAPMITKDVKDFREPTEWWSRTSRKMPRISEVRVDNTVRDSAKTSSTQVSWETGTKTTCTRVPGDSQRAAQASHLPKRPITVSETLYRVEDRSQCWRHCTVSETLRFFAQSGPGT